MLNRNDGQGTLYDDLLDSMVREEHAYRKVLKLVDFELLTKPLESLYSSNKGVKGYPVDKGFKCLLIQYWEDLSDREMEDGLKDNIAIRWFCGFPLYDKTPDHSYFGDLRKRMGAERLAELFNKVNESLRAQKLISDVFTFVDSKAIISKVKVWEERDKARKDGIDKLNNSNVGKYSKDKDARFGCKGKKDFWVGYKVHDAVDMKHGFITKLEVTPANTLDFQAFEKICPDSGMIFCDKGYDYNAVYEYINGKEIYSGIIQKNNNKKKDKYLDRWRSSVRAPFEGIHNLFNKKTRYRGVIKTKFQKTFEALVINLKRLIKLAEDIVVLPISQASICHLEKQG